MFSYLDRDDNYYPLYENGDTLVNGEGHEIKIINIVADQYMYNDLQSDNNPHYEFCTVIDYWYTTKQKYSDWIKPLNERLNKIHDAYSGSEIELNF